MKKEYFKNTFATLNPGESGTHVMLSGSEDWSPVSKNIKLFKGDVIKTSNFASIGLIGESKINLDKGAIILIDKIQSNNSSSQVQLTVPEGRVWFDIKRMINPKSIFEIKSGNLFLSTRNGIFSLNGNSLRVIEGSVLVNFKDGNKDLGKMEVGVGQELVISDSDFDSIKVGTMPLVRAINDEFKLSSWYFLNYKHNGKNDQDNNLQNSEDDKIADSDNLKEKESDTLKSDSDKLPGAQAVKSDIEDLSVKKVEHKGDITLDVESTDVEIFKDEIVHLFGKVPTGANSVKVNNWKLGKFEAGSSDWKYNGALKWENIKEGENIYKVEVFDVDGLKFAEKEFKIFLKIKKDPVEEKKVEDNTENNTETNKKEELNKSSSKDLGGVQNLDKKNEDSSVKSDVVVETSLQITSHQDGQFVTILDGQSLEIKGIPSTGAASIKVGDYTLTGFKEGDKNFIFRIAEEWGNAKIGEKNNFEITSYDNKGREIEVLNFSLFIEK